MRMAIAASAGAMAAGLALAGCGAGPNDGSSLSALIESYCEATTPTLRAIARIPLIALLDLEGDPGELLCVDDGTAVRFVPADETAAPETFRVPAPDGGGPAVDKPYPDPE